MRQCGDEVRELLHDGCPVVCLGDAPFGYVNVFSAHVNVGFLHGAGLPDPAHLLQGTGKLMRGIPSPSRGGLGWGWGTGTSPIPLPTSPLKGGGEYRPRHTALRDVGDRVRLLVPVLGPQEALFLQQLG